MAYACGSTVTVLQFLHGQREYGQCVAPVANCPHNLNNAERKREYKAALVETDCDELQKCIAAAELAIPSRLQVLAGKAGHEQ
jgi:hypothetical protein